MKIIITILALVLSISINAQTKDELLNKVTEKACECIEDYNFEGKSGKEIEMGLGLCILKGYTPYKQKFIDINAAYDINGYEQLGEEIGLKMVDFCPNTFSKLFGNEELIDSIYEDETNENLIEYSIKGKFQKITGTDFNYIHIKDENGKNQKFLWLGNFDGSDKFINDLKSIKKVTVYYKNTECFIPKMEEYFMQKEITKVVFL